MPKIDVWMPWYISDYQSDTAHLNPPQDSAYRRLLEHQWKTRRPLPNDLQALIQVTKMSPFFVDASSIPQACHLHVLKMGRASASKDERMLYAWILDLLQQFFVQNPDGTWSQLRLERELLLWGKKNEKAANRAKKGAWARWHPGEPMPADESPIGGESGPNRADASSIAHAKPEDCPSPSPLSTKANTKPGVVPTPTPQSAATGLRASPVSSGSRSSKTQKPRLPAAPAAGRSATAPPARSTPTTPPKNAPGAPGSGSGIGRGAPLPKDHRGVASKNEAIDTTNGSDQPKAGGQGDLRFEAFRQEYFKYWKGVNRETIDAGKLPADVPFSNLNRIALGRWLNEHPGVTIEMFRNMLWGRVHKNVSPSTELFRWINDIFSFASSTDRYGRRI